MSVSENKHNHYLSIVIIVLIVINIIVNVLSMKTVENIEIMKVGGKENYEKLQVIMQSDAYKEQYAQNLELMLQQIQGGGSEELLPEQEAMEETSTFTGEEVIESNDIVTTGDSFDSNQLQGDQ
jgi:hypothetical protein